MASRSRWGDEGPPEEAYGRVTDPERFAPLHDAALEMIGRLEADFDVQRVEGYGLDEELESKRGLARPSVRLSPADPEAAPITVVFTDFPGLFVRFGRWKEELFPVCGCDACDETAESGIESLIEKVDLGDGTWIPRGCPGSQGAVWPWQPGGGVGDTLSWPPLVQDQPRSCAQDVRRTPPPGAGLEAVASAQGVVPRPPRRVTP